MDHSSIGWLIRPPAHDAPVMFIYRAIGIDRKKST